MPLLQPLTSEVKHLSTSQPWVVTSAGTKRGPAKPGYVAVWGSGPGICPLGVSGLRPWDKELVSREKHPAVPPPHPSGMGKEGSKGEGETL